MAASSWSADLRFQPQANNKPLARRPPAGLHLHTAQHAEYVY